MPKWMNRVSEQIRLLHHTVAVMQGQTQEHKKQLHTLTQTVQLQIVPENTKGAANRVQDDKIARAKTEENLELQRLVELFQKADTGRKEYLFHMCAMISRGFYDQIGGQKLSYGQLLAHFRTKIAQINPSCVPTDLLQYAKRIRITMQLEKYTAQKDPNTTSSHIYKDILRSVDDRFKRLEERCKRIETQYQTLQPIFCYLQQQLPGLRSEKSETEQSSGPHEQVPGQPTLQPVTLTIDGPAASTKAPAAASITTKDSATEQKTTSSDDVKDLSDRIEELMASSTRCQRFADTVLNEVDTHKRQIEKIQTRIDNLKKQQSGKTDQIMLKLLEEKKHHAENLERSQKAFSDLHNIVSKKNTEALHLRQRVRELLLQNKSTNIRKRKQPSPSLSMSPRQAPQQEKRSKSTSN